MKINRSYCLNVVYANLHGITERDADTAEGATLMINTQRKLLIHARDMAVVATPERSREIVQISRSMIRLS
jgi:hypothetical protein